MGAESEFELMDEDSELFAAVQGEDRPAQVLHNKGVLVAPHHGRSRCTRVVSHWQAMFQGAKTNKGVNLESAACFRGIVYDLVTV